MNISFKNSDKIIIREAGDLYLIMQKILKRERLVDRTKEHFWTVALNAAHKILNIELVSMGSRDKSVVDAVQVFSIPLQKKAYAVLLVHNHPSESLKPSESDLDLTNKLIQAGAFLDTHVLDHLIISQHSYYSLADNGVIEDLRWSSKYAATYVLEKELKREIAKINKEADKRAIEGEKIGRQAGKKEGIEVGEKRGLWEGEKIGEKKGIELGEKVGEERGKKAGKQAGIKIGEKLGEERGFEIGEEKGRQEEKIEIAKHLLTQGIDIKTIQESTGLSLQRLRKLKNEKEGIL